MTHLLQRATATVSLLLTLICVACIGAMAAPELVHAEEGQETAKILSVKVLNPGPLSPNDLLFVEIETDCGEGSVPLPYVQYAAHEDGIYTYNSGEVYGIDIFALASSSNGQFSLENSWPPCDSTPRVVSGKHVIALGLSQCSKNGKWYIEGNYPNHNYSLSGYSIIFENPTFEIDTTKQDSSGPLLQGVRVDTCNQGERAKVRLVAHDPSKVSKVTIGLKSVSGESYVKASTAIPPTYNSDYNNYVADIQLPYNADLGDWVVDSVSLEDAYGNESRYALDAAGTTLMPTYPRSDRSDGVVVAPFKVIQPADTQIMPPAPSLTSFAVLNENRVVQRPGSLNLRFGVHEESAGTTKVEIRAKRDDGKSETYSYFGPYKNGTYDVSMPIPASAYVGTWELEVTLTDSFGNQKRILPSGVHDARGLPITQTAPHSSNTGSYTEVLSLPGFEVKDEFDFAFNTSLSYPMLVEQIKSMPDGKAARISIDGNRILPKAVFDAIRGTNKTLVCWSGQYQWVLHGWEIKGQTKDIDLGLNIGRIEAKDLNSTEPAVSLEFRPNGTLPGVAHVRFKSDYLYKFAGVKGNLKLFYLQNGKCAREKTDFDLVFDGTDKWCYVDISHNSTFLISTQTLTTVRSKTSPINLRNAALRLSKSAYTYTGKAIKPGITVKVGGKTLKAGTDYAVSYKSNKAVGTATITVTGKGSYTGSKSATFKINPKGTSVKGKVAAGKKSFTVKWAKLSKANLKQATGYQVRYSLKKNMKGAKVKTVKAASSAGKKCTLKVSKLKGGKKYYVQVRTYKKAGGKMYYSGWSKAKTVKVKK